MMTLRNDMLIKSDADGDTNQPRFNQNQYQHSITLSLFAVRKMSIKDKLIESV